jgi:hypothetical protein
MRNYESNPRFIFDTSRKVEKIRKYSVLCIINDVNESVIRDLWTKRMNDRNVAMKVKV